MRSDRQSPVCVIGAGSGGLTAAKNFTQAGFAVEVLEREADLGGNWNYDLPCSRVYRSTHMISSKSFTQYTDYPMPEKFPDYPHHSQVLKYLRYYTKRFKIEPLIRYGRSVERVEPGASGGWEVTTNVGPTRHYAALVIANGHNWSPRWPSYPGEFSGQTLHSAQYKTPDIFAGKRVLVVGGGNSGCDIAVEASHVAAATVHSTRRGYHYVPKYIFGRPSDALADRLANRRVPLWLRRLVMSLVVRVMAGSPQMAGLPAPDHRLFDTHPIVNSLFPYHVQHGDIRPKPDIVRLDGRAVHFHDGSAEEFDVIVYATGYNVVFPFIDNALLNWHDGRPRLYKHVFHPQRDDLFVIGMIQPDAGIFGLMDRQAQAAALFLSALREGLPAAKRLRACKGAGEVGIRQKIRYQESARHVLEVEHWGYAQELDRLIAQLGHVPSNQVLNMNDAQSRAIPSCVLPVNDKRRAA